MVEGTIERGLRPLPTLHHFTNPLWFTLGGDWSRPDAAERFLRYVDALTPVPEASVERVETINEPNIFAALASLQAPEAAISLTDFRCPMPRRRR